MWANNYEDLLFEWQDLRKTSQALPVQDAFHCINDWWQQAPTIPHYIHFNDYETWPNPWEILADNNYCESTKILGIMYTVILMDLPEDTTFKMLKDENNTYLEVKLGTEKYTFANEIGIINSKFKESEILYQIDCNYFKNKL